MTSSIFIELFKVSSECIDIVEIYKTMDVEERQHKVLTSIEQIIDTLEEGTVKNKLKKFSDIVLPDILDWASNYATDRRSFIRRLFTAIGCLVAT